MSIKTAYISSLGRDHRISENFTLGEMQCKDGTDKVLYSTELLAKLEELRGYGGFTIVINSGYRTAAYNRKIGGASASQHIKGTAADISVKKDGNRVDSKLICCLCQSLGFRGIAYISGGSVHVDMRSAGSYRGDERSGYSGNVGNDFYRYFNIDRGQIENLKASREEDEDMTQERFNQLMEEYLRQQRAKEPSDWSEKERQWAQSNGLILGDAEGNMQYKLFCDREQVIVFLYRLMNLMREE